MASQKTIKIDVVSDFVCAWCYIGHLELLRGISLARSRGLPVEFVIQYHPFVVNPSLSQDRPISKDQYFLRKFGSLEKTHEILEMVRLRAKEEGLDLSFRGCVRQTTRAHRLLQKAYFYGGQRAQCAVLRRLFRAFFEDEQDIGDPRTLAKIASSQAYPFSSPNKAGSNGIPEITVEKSGAEAEFDAHADDDAAAIFDSEEEALAWVEGNELEKEVRTMAADAARKGVAGVPFTVIDGRWAVSGCQKPECYYKIFAKLASSESCPHSTESNGIQKMCTGESCQAESPQDSI
ncbi:hypothetical protein ACEPAI_7383 [Sanghuangporus weigelae]